LALLPETIACGAGGLYPSAAMKVTAASFYWLNSTSFL